MSAHVGSSKNLNDLKDVPRRAGGGEGGRTGGRGGSMGGGRGVAMGVEGGGGGQTEAGVICSVRGRVPCFVLDTV